MEAHPSFKLLALYTCPYVPAHIKSYLIIPLRHRIMIISVTKQVRNKWRTPSDFLIFKVVQVLHSLTLQRRLLTEFIGDSTHVSLLHHRKPQSWFPEIPVTYAILPFTLQGRKRITWRWEKTQKKWMRQLFGSIVFTQLESLCAWLLITTADSHSPTTRFAHTIRQYVFVATLDIIVTCVAFWSSTLL